MKIKNYNSFFSWEISGDYALKHGDVSFHKYNITGIPQQIRFFFDIVELKENEKRDIIIEYENNTYDAYIENRNNKTRMKWHNDLANLFNCYYDNERRYPDILFKKISNNKYVIEIIMNYRFDESVIITNSEYEGNKKLYYTTKYERSTKNRSEAIRIHGTKCSVCGFDFSAFYGDLGKNYIEVHHLKPLHSLEEEIIINPKDDLICLCSNCHRMIHIYGDRILTPEELKKIINNQKNNT